MRTLKSHPCSTSSFFIARIFSVILDSFTFVDNRFISILLEDRIPKPHGFTYKRLHSGIHIFNFKIFLFGSGGNTTINVTGTYDYTNHISSLITVMNNAWKKMLGSIFHADNGVIPNNFSNSSNSYYVNAIESYNRFNCAYENKLTNSLPHFLLSSKSKYGNMGLSDMYPDILSNMHNILSISTPLISIMAPYLLYITLPRVSNLVNAYMVYITEDQVRSNRLRELNTQFDNRYNTIMTHIGRTRNNWASFWNYVETVRGQGIDFIIEANTGEIDILLPLNPTEQIEQRANRLSTQTNVLVGQLVDIARLIARNRFTASLIQRDDSTFVASDEVIISELTPILEQTQNLYNILDFEETVRETLHDLNNSYDENEPGDSSQNTGKKRDRSDFDPDYDNTKRMKNLNM